MVDLKSGVKCECKRERNGGGEATECFIPARKGGEARTGARHDGGKVAARLNLSRGGAA
jgi:hypothetical protein